MIHLKCGLLAALALVLAAGCGWDGDDTDDFTAWNDSYSWLNYSGVYRSPSGGLLVTDFTTPGSGTEPPQELSYSQNFGTGVAGLHAYGGRLAKTPVVAGSLTIDCGSFHFSDNGASVLVGSVAGTTGTISYDTGVWSISLGALEFPAGVDIVANWRYTQGGTSGQVGPGNTGPAIYTMSVSQTGNVLVFRDSSGARYEGFISGVSAPGDENITPQGTSTRTTTRGTGQAVAQFEVQGTSRAGQSVTISGTLQLDYDGSALSGRVMNATWVEAGGATGDIVGNAG